MHRAVLHAIARHPVSYLHVRYHTVSASAVCAMFTAYRDLLTGTRTLSQIYVAILDTPTPVTERGRGAITALGPSSGNTATYRCVVSDDSVIVSSSQCSTVVRNTVVRATMKVNGKHPILDPLAP